MNDIADMSGSLFAPDTGELRCVLPSLHDGMPIKSCHTDSMEEKIGWKNRSSAIPEQVRVSDMGLKKSRIAGAVPGASVRRAHWRIGECAALQIAVQ